MRDIEAVVQTATQRSGVAQADLFGWAVWDDLLLRELVTFFST